MKVSLSKVSVLGVLALSTMAAQAQRHGGNGHAGYDRPTQIVHRVNRTLYTGDIINLQRAFARKLAAGQKIQSIRVVTSSAGYNSKIVLKENGLKTSVVRLGHSGSGQRMNVQNPYSHNLKLVVKGSAYIQRVVAQVVQSYGGGTNAGEVLKAQVNQHTYATTKIPVKQIVKQATGVRLNGLKVNKVVFKAKATRWSNATVQVLVNGVAVGRKTFLTNQLQRVAVKLSSYQRNIIGQDIRKIQLLVRGEALVKMVGIKVKNQTGHSDGYYDEDSYEDTVTVRVQQLLQGQQRITMSELLGYQSSIMMNKAISQLEITTIGNGRIKLAGAGYSRRGASNGRRSSVNGTAVFQINDGSTSTADLALETSGSLTIKKVTVTYAY